MSKPKKTPFEFDPLVKFTFKERLLIRVADVALYALIRFVGLTIRFEREGEENYQSIIDAGKMPIWAFWHDRIFLTTYFGRGNGIVVITSQSKDGEFIARFIRRFGYGAIRGSSTRGGLRALAEMTRSLQSGLPMAFTVDGPKGPRYVVKPGAVMLAKKTGHPIFPMLIEPKHYWTIRSWDRLQIPWPFTRARVFGAKPIYVSPDAEGDEFRAKVEEFQRSMDALVERGRQWRTSGQ